MRTEAAILIKSGGRYHIGSNTYVYVLKVCYVGEDYCKVKYELRYKSDDTAIERSSAKLRNSAIGHWQTYTG